MSRKKAKDEYIAEVTAFGNSAKIKAAKKHIGKKAKVTIINEGE